MGKIPILTHILQGGLKALLMSTIFSFADSDGSWKNNVATMVLLTVEIVGDLLFFFRILTVILGDSLKRFSMV